MYLSSILLILLLGALLAWIAAQWRAHAGRWVALLALLINLIWTVYTWYDLTMAHTPPATGWWMTVQKAWIPAWGISLYLALDGLSLLMLMLTFFLGILAVLISWREIQFRIGFFHTNLLLVLAGITGVFLAMDLFLFYFFWELMLIPMYLLISIWGHENRTYAANKFFLFTQAGGLLMLLSILSLYFWHGAQTGTYTYAYDALVQHLPSDKTALLMMSGFVVAFAVKLPVVPLHTWLPDAHSQAPTAGSLILAGLLLKTGAYGLIRFVLPLFPNIVDYYGQWGMLLGVVGILYGGILAFAQTDLKRMIAYTSVSHMGFVMLGLFAGTALAQQGVILQMLAHGISTGALFLIAGMLHERIHTRDMTHMGGFWQQAPAMGVMALIFSMASLGLPGLGNFVAEILILIGSWPSAPLLTILATIGIVVATIYSLGFMQRIFFGAAQTTHPFPDMNAREYLMLLSLAAVLLWMGLYPQPLLDTAASATNNTLHYLTHR
jgi:NADH-quinone oxidoreductase subunit M